MAFVTGQSWSAVNLGKQGGGGAEQGFQCCFADGLNQRVGVAHSTPREDKLPLKPPSRRDVALILV